MPLVPRLSNEPMIFPILSGVKSANTEATLPQRSEKEESADQSETDIEYIDN